MTAAWHGFAIEVHSMEGCPWCDRAKAWLRGRGHEFTEVRHDDRAERNAFYDSLGLEGVQRTVPQVLFLDGGDVTRVGGFAELERSGL